VLRGPKPRWAAATAGVLVLATFGCGDKHTADSSGCPRRPLLGVYDPSRLTVLQQCASYRGTVMLASRRSDGDVHIDIAPHVGYDRFLNKGNEKDQGGGLVVEIMPGQEFPQPVEGEHLVVFGTWVHDEHNDWNEMHPVWRIDYLDRGSHVTSLPPSTPVYHGNADD
jgi:hypothetical protein